MENYNNVFVTWKNFKSYFQVADVFYHHTVRKSQIVSKKSIFGKNNKLVNLNICAKNSQNSTFSIFVDSVLIENHDFWRENSNYQGKTDI